MAAAIVAATLGQVFAEPLATAGVSMRPGASSRANIRAVRCRLGDTVFDDEARRLVRHGDDVHLSPKAFELLKFLIEQRPRAVSKSELHEHLWPSTFVSDVNLASLVAEVRSALGDSARNSRFVRTAQRFGYAFCGEVTAAETAPTLTRA